MPTARSVYDVRVLDCQPGETGRAWFTGVLAALFSGGDSSGAAERVRVEIVVIDTGEPLMDWMEYPMPAEALKERIESDLNQMDADTFAAEWGLPTSSE
jgi:hypothetical protein